MLWPSVLCPEPRCSQGGGPHPHHLQRQRGGVYINVISIKLHMYLKLIDKLCQIKIKRRKKYIYPELDIWQRRYADGGRRDVKISDWWWGPGLGILIFSAEGVWGNGRSRKLTLTCPLLFSPEAGPKTLLWKVPSLYPEDRSILIPKTEGHRDECNMLTWLSLLQFTTLTSGPLS